MTRRDAAIPSCRTTPGYDFDGKSTRATRIIAPSVRTISATVQPGGRASNSSVHAPGPADGIVLEFRINMQHRPC